MKTVDFSETIAAFDLEVGRCRQLIEVIKVNMSDDSSPSYSQNFSFKAIIKICRYGKPKIILQLLYFANL